jgi:hypothetical protein
VVPTLTLRLAYLITTINLQMAEMLTVVTAVTLMAVTLASELAADLKNNRLSESKIN